MLSSDRSSERIGQTPKEVWHAATQHEAIEYRKAQEHGQAEDNRQARTRQAGAGEAEDHRQAQEHGQAQERSKKKVATAGSDSRFGSRGL